MALGRMRFALDHRLASARMSDYLDEELGRAMRRRLTHHLSECHECRELLASLRRVLAVLGAAAAADAREPAPPLAAAAPALGLQVVMGERFAAMGANLVANVTAGRVGVAQIVATREDR